MLDCGLNFSGSGQRPVVNSFGLFINPKDSQKTGEFLNSCWFLKKCIAPWS